MNKLKLEIEVENDAFGAIGGVERGAELKRILEVAAAKIEHFGLMFGESFDLRDINGNAVGSVKYEQEK